MTSPWFIFLGVLLVVSQSSCDTLDWSIENNVTVPGYVVSNGVNRFGVDLFRALSCKRENFVYSPFSIYMGLGMLYLMTSGQTKMEIGNVLSIQQCTNAAEGFRDVIKSSVFDRSVVIGNRVFVDESFPLKMCYLNDLQDYMEAGSENIMFSNPEMARQHINRWVSEKTHGTIPVIFEQGTIEHDTKLALVNTLYFKESWMYPFSDFLTELRVFHTENGETKMVPMMTNVEYFKYANIPSLGLKAVKLPYKDYNKKLIIMKPYTHDGLPRLEQVLTYDHIRSEILDMMSYSALKVMIPKFSMDNSFSLKGVLKKMGLKKIFDASSADFSATVFGQGLEVTSIQHKVHLEVDENGTIASAATGIGASSRSTMVITDTFIADGPFLFAVCDKKTRGILFMGRYMGPP